MTALVDCQGYGFSHESCSFRRRRAALANLNRYIVRATRRYFRDNDRDQLTELAAVWRGAGHAAQSAATIALVAPVETEPRQREAAQYDLGQATMSMLIAATDLVVHRGRW